MLMRWPNKKAGRYSALTEEVVILSTSFPSDLFKLLIIPRSISLEALSISVPMSVFCLIIYDPSIDVIILSININSMTNIIIVYIAMHMDVWWFDWKLQRRR